MTGEHVGVNRDFWDGMAQDWVEPGKWAWISDEPTWGLWRVPETELKMLPGDMSNMTAIELGCGTGYVSRWMERRGATVTGIDVSKNQLETARRLAGEHGSAITFVEGDAEATGFADGAFDFAISEYGAAIWCDPEVWLREAWRLLKVGGELVFLGNHPLSIVCMPENGAPAERTLHRSYRQLTKADWREVEIEPGGVEFNRPISGWMDLFREVGFSVKGYHELYAAEGAKSMEPSVPVEWAREYPSEQVWKLVKV